MMSELFGEFLGTLILILLGNGVVAGVVLPKTKSNSAGWIVITMGWGIAVAVAVFVSGKLSPARRGHAGSDFGLVAIQTAL
ncbi:glycerol uptake facilitator protein [Streptococcus pneumoniae]|nr:glycerol uptake facilitator protein [Streptococcus pneumoniae]VQK65332.1 glycerol uptake facilitator protein [Streptococcus pneumoniae]